MTPSGGPDIVQTAALIICQCLGWWAQIFYSYKYLYMYNLYTNTCIIRIIFMLKMCGFYKCMTNHAITD